MDLGFSSEQDMLRKSVAEFFEILKKLVDTKAVGP